jgi:hypothetical protein
MNIRKLLQWTLILIALIAFKEIDSDSSTADDMVYTSYER